MHTKNLARFFLFASIVPALIAQAPAAPPTPPAAATPTAPQAARRTPQSPPSVVAGIPVNYDEAKVGTYTLPDPLMLEQRQAGEECEDLVDKAAAGD